MAALQIVSQTRFTDENERAALNALNVFWREKDMLKFERITCDRELDGSAVQLRVFFKNDFEVSVSTLKCSYHQLSIVLKTDPTVTATGTHMVISYLIGTDTLLDTEPKRAHEDTSDHSRKAPRAESTSLFGFLKR